MRKIEEKVSDSDEERSVHAELNHNDVKDEVMENVLSWSRAKGVGSAGSAGSAVTKPESPAPVTLSPNSIFRQQEVRGTVTDWVREVPVELFTISRLVGDKKNKEEESK